MADSANNVQCQQKMLTQQKCGLSNQSPLSGRDPEKWAWPNMQMSCQSTK